MRAFLVQDAGGTVVCEGAEFSTGLVFIVSPQEEWLPTLFASYSAFLADLAFHPPGSSIRSL